jgi:RNA polymerase primary sigma factor
LVQQHLTARQERDLVTAAECGDSAACRRLVEVFLPAIGGIAAGFRGDAFESRELLQEGVAGLLFAARRYDPGLNTPFWAYASFWVRKAMQEFVAELAPPVSLSDRAVRELARIKSARRDYEQTRRAEPSSEALSRATGLTRHKIERLQATERVPRTIDEPLAADGESSETLGETIADPAAEQAYQHVLDELEIGYLRDLTNELDERERAVVRAHYGLGERPKTLGEIGATLGLTAERARQIETAALSKLRSRLAEPAALAPARDLQSAL